MARMNDMKIRREVYAQRIHPDLHEWLRGLNERVSEGVPYDPPASFSLELAIKLARYFLDEAPKRDRLSIARALELTKDL